MNQEAHLDSFTVFSLTKQNKENLSTTTHCPDLGTTSPLKQSSSIFPQVNTERPSPWYQIADVTIAREKGFEPPEAPGNTSCTNTSVMGLLLVLLVIVGSSNLFPAHFSNELQHSMESNPSCQPWAPTLHTHTPWGTKGAGTLISVWNPRAKIKHSHCKFSTYWIPNDTRETPTTSKSSKLK